MAQHLLRVTEREMVTLIEEARRDRPLVVAWGTGCVIVTPDDRWALDRVCELRQEGAR